MYGQVYRLRHKYTDEPFYTNKWGSHCLSSLALVYMYRYVEFEVYNSLNNKTIAHKSKEMKVHCMSFISYFYQQRCVWLGIVKMEVHACQLLSPTSAAARKFSYFLF